MTLYMLGFITLRLLCLGFFILLAARVAVGLRSRRRDGAMEALERRFVAGEISEEDFRAMRDVLRS
jgi:uncharacterized membrane protein